ncbi:NfeD family protein [Chloroflexota bacterium]
MGVIIGGFVIDLWLIIVLIIVGVICIIAFSVVTIVWGIRAHRLQVAAGREDLIGKTAEVKVATDPKGMVFIQGEQWMAISESGRVESGEEVVITKVDGLKLYVTKKQ